MVGLLSKGSAKEKGALSRFHPIKTVLIFFQKKSKTTHATSCLKIAPILMRAEPAPELEVINLVCLHHQSAVANTFAKFGSTSMGRMSSGCFPVGCSTEDDDSFACTAGRAANWSKWRVRVWRRDLRTCRFRNTRELALLRIAERSQSRYSISRSRAIAQGASSSCKRITPFRFTPTISRRVFQPKSRRRAV